MPADLIDGAAMAADTLDRIAGEVHAGVEAGLRPPCIATVLVGGDPASHTYVRMKVRRAGLGSCSGSVCQAVSDSTT